MIERSQGPIYTSEIKDIFVRIKAISALGPSVYGSFCGVHLIPFTRKDEKDRPIK